MTKLEYFGKWLKFLDGKDYLISRMVAETNLIPEKLICPEYKDIFKAFNLCHYEDLKVVMIGQDPYPQRGVATGILFGNKKEVSEENLSPSLKVVKEACINFEIPHNNIIFDQTLESWAKQGILMINSALTVEVGKVGSHTMMWRPFMVNLMKSLSHYNTGIIYVLFGEQAKTFKPYINAKTNIILEEKHPAYYARVERKMPSRVFEEVSKLTKAMYGESIKFYLEDEKI